MPEAAISLREHLPFTATSKEKAGTFYVSFSLLLIIYFTCNLTELTTRSTCFTLLHGQQYVQDTHEPRSIML